MAEQESLSQKTLKNAAYGFIGYVWPIAFSVFITPIVVHRLGVTNYGIYVFMNTTMAFMALFDFGLSVALIKYISEYVARKDFAALQKLMNSAWSLYWIIGLVGLLIFLIIGKFLLPVFHLDSSNANNLFQIFAITGLIFFVNTVNYVYLAVPSALQRFDIGTKLNLAQLTALNFIILGLVLMGFGLRAIFIANLLTIIGLTTAYRHYFKRLLPQVRLQFSWDVAEIKKSYSFGFLAALTNLASNSLIQLDRFIIPIFVGPASLSYYSLPGNVAQKTAGVVGSLGSVFFPLTSALVGAGQLESVRTIYYRAIRNLTVLAAACTAAIAVFAFPILHYWLGSDFANRGFRILQILAVTYLVLAVYGPLTNFLLGMGKVKFLTAFSLFLAFLNLALLLILIPKYGIQGAAWAYLGGVVPIPFAFYWTEQRYLRLFGNLKFYSILFAKLLVVTVIFYGIMKFIVIKAITGLPTLIIFGPLSVAVYIGIYYALGFFEDEDKILFGNFLKRIKNKFLMSGNWEQP